MTILKRNKYGERIVVVGLMYVNEQSNEDVGQDCCEIRTRSVIDL